MSIGESLGYRSPVSKLIRFFRRSRDNWKAKCKAAKRENKSLKIRLAKMRESRDRWKAQAKSAAMEARVGVACPQEEAKNGVGHRPGGGRPRAGGPRRA